MPTNFEIAVISLVAINIIANIYYNYHSEESYAAEPIRAFKTKRQKPPK